MLVLTEEVAAVVSVLPSFSPSLACPAEKDGPSDGFPPRDRGREGSSRAAVCDGKQLISSEMRSVVKSHLR